MGSYKHAAVCRRGHVYARDITMKPHAHRCATCGGRIIDACPGCSTNIRGSYHAPGVATVARYSPPQFCFSCGSPFPWASRQARIYELQNLLDEESLDEADRLTVVELLTSLQEPGLDDQEQFERWSRVKKLAPGLMSSGQRIIETVVTATVKSQLGL